MVFEISNKGNKMENISYNTIILRLNPSGLYVTLGMQQREAPKEVQTMNKLIRTSACTLGLSLLIAFGFSQNSISYGKEINTNPNTTKVVKSVTSNKAVYKKINLSNCKSVKDVVNNLRNSGYTNITTKSIKDVKGLKEALAKIQSKYADFNKKQTETTPAKTETTSKTTDKDKTAEKTTTTNKQNTTNTAQSDYAKEVLRLVNIEREKAGLKALTTNTTLTAAADKRAQETVKSFSHTRPNGTGFQTVLKEFGISYKAAGENIAYGQKTPQEVVTGWMNSSGHRANILNKNFGKIGVGVYQSGGTIYWTQVFTD